MSQNLLILGRQPALGLAELESLYGDTVRPFGATAATVDAAVDFGRLGGSVKAAQIIHTLDTTDWKKVESYLIQHASNITSDGEGKLQLGISTYGFNETAARVNATGLSLKKAVRKAGRPVRLVPNQAPALSSAQVFHNNLITERGCEIIVVADGKQTIIGRATGVQDIDSYTIRDRSRPKRDSRVGMLPPKLAQIIINLATSSTEPAGKTILDPFCGTGVVLQESLLMGFNAYGTDLEPRMVDYSGENLDWLDDQFELKDVEMRIEVGDATSHTWEPAPNIVAGETYLGRPYTTAPPAEQLNKNASDCNLILKKFLRNIYGQLAPGTRLCLAIPAWQVRKNQFKHLPLVDQISDLGYNQVSFAHIGSDQLLYYREDQIVARELLVITRK